MKTVLAFLLMGISLALTSCYKPDCNAKETHELISSFSADQLSKFPFRNEGIDTFHYLSNSGIKAEVYGNGARKGVYTESMTTSGMDCQSRFYREGELISYSFNCIKIPAFYLHFMSRGPCLGLCSKSYIFQHDEYSYLADPINDDQFYKDTIIIESIPYSGIELSDPFDSTFSIFYNHHYGILRIKSYSITWLKKK